MTILVVTKRGALPIGFHEVDFLQEEIDQVSFDEQTALRVRAVSQELSPAKARANKLRAKFARGEFKLQQWVERPTNIS